jgi:N-acyl-D-amino-acid deacylase
MFCPALLYLAFAPTGFLIQGGTIYDGLGGPPRVADLRIEHNSIQAIGHLKPRVGEIVIDARGLAVAPGFIDSHSHADGGIFDDPDAETQVRQGITTAVVGEDGGSSFPLRDFWAKLKANPASINFASFVGHGTVRSQVMGEAMRNSSFEERAKMAKLVDQEMQSGALGLSSGLEYQPGRYGNVEELVELAKAAAKHRGMYISHVRNEDDTAFEAFDELVQIARRAKLPAEINHIKLGSASVWGKADQVREIMAKSSKEGLSIWADVYPYLYWQSTIRVIIPTEEFEDRSQWEKGLANIGGPEHVLLTRFTPDPKWQGRTIADIAKTDGRDPITIIQDVIHRCYGPGATGKESVVVTAMNEDDLKTFVANPQISFCSDGGLHGSHPRGAGSFPRILGRYVREQRVISLTEAIRKMTSLPATRFGFRDRGQLKPGMKADITIFDPEKVIDTATTDNPQSKPIGIGTVFVNGQPVLRDGVITKLHPGRGLPKKR